jgi:hypothetical protein
MELTPEQARLRESRGPLVEALGISVQKNNCCKCPYHDDQHPSASVHLDKDEVWRFHCFTCKWKGDVFDVIARNQGRQLGDVLKEAKGEPESKPTIYPTLEKVEMQFRNREATYKYTHPDTKVIELVVIRYWDDNRKRFAQASPFQSGWILKAPQGKLPLYNRTRVREAESVIVVEGEKAVHALTSVGIVATTSPGGAGKAHKADWSPLAGKQVYLWADNDPVDPKTGEVTGEQHMQDVQAILKTMDTKLFWIDQKGLDLPPKGDAVEFLERNGGEKGDKRIAVQLVMDEAIPLGAAKQLESRIESMISGEWVNIEWPWYEMTMEAQALLPETVTAICGDPGAAKSFFMLEAFCHWHIAGEKTALFMLEDDRTYHLQRVLAQLEQNSRLTDSTWIAANPDQARVSVVNQRDIIESFGRTIYDAPDKIVTLTDLADWFEKRCQEGVTICGIDPVTAVKVSDQPWIDDQKFVFHVKAIAKKYHSRLIYVIHPRISNGKGRPSLSLLAGGAAYPRFSHSVFWLTRHDSPENAIVYSSDHGKRTVTYDRTLKISKARNGRGAGKDLAFTMNPETLCFTELGVVLAEVSNAAVSYES